MTTVFSYIQLPNPVQQKQEPIKSPHSRERIIRRQVQSYSFWRRADPKHDLIFVLIRVHSDKGQKWGTTELITFTL